VSAQDEPYYRRDLARIHHLGFGFHADATAPGVLSLLASVKERGGLVVEIGCGSGLLTRYLIDAGHRLIATDASPAMLDLARQTVPDAEDLRLVALPDDPLPEADAIVGVGHALNYLPDEASIDRALAAIADALRPGGVLVIDLCDLEWGRARMDEPPRGWVGEDWALVTRFSTPTPDRYVREMATFTRNDDGSWRRDDERHDNVLMDTARIPAVLAEHGVDATVRASFGDEDLPAGLKAVVGSKRG
jgi:SAM-dependent methyltransferase